MKAIVTNLANSPDDPLVTIISVSYQDDSGTEISSEDIQSANTETADQLKTRISEALNQFQIKYDKQVELRALLDQPIESSG